MFRFTIRDVLWLTVVAAMGVLLWKEWARLQEGWVVVEKERATIRSEQAALAAKRRALDAQFLKVVDMTDQLNLRLQRSDKTDP